METQSAINSFQKAVDLDREDPIGYAFLSLAHSFAGETSFEPRDQAHSQEHMLRSIQESLAKGQRRIETNAQDSRAYLAMTVASIVKARWAIRQKSYLVAMHDTAHAWDYMTKAKDADPQGCDIYLPIGLVHYHIDQLSRLVRFFSSLLITSGDREKGLQEVGLAAQKGDLLKELAKAELSAVYINYEKQPVKALPLIEKLKERFPRNYNFSFGLALTLSQLNRFEEAFALAKEIETGIQYGKAPFVPQLQPRFENLMGRILFNQGEYAKATEYFERVLNVDAPYNMWNRASALLRLGMIHDLRRERKDAEGYYSRVLAIEGVEGSAKGEARKYLKTPYALPPEKSNP